MNKKLLNEISEFIETELNLDINDTDIECLYDKLTTEYDFYIEIDGEEYRFIAETHIWDIYVEGIKEMVQDCYDLNIPEWVAVDWEETAENCHVDGYGHHFSHYDGSEIEYTLNDEFWHIFRTN